MGLLVGLAVQIMLNLFGLSIGLAAMGPTPGQPLPATQAPVAALVWWFVSALLALVATGFVVGWLRRDQSLLDTAIFSSTAWALTTIFTLWFATTLTGSAIGGAYALLIGETRQQAQVRLRIEQPRRTPAVTGPTLGISPASRPNGPRPAASDLRNTLESLTWIAVVEAARQLRDPEVRDTIRQLAMFTWRESGSFRAALTRKLDAWIAAGGQLETDTATDIETWLREGLLIDRQTAKQIVADWQARLATARSQSAASEPDRNAGAGAVAGAGAGTSPPAPSDAAADERIATLKQRIVTAIENLRQLASRLISKGGTFGPEMRAAAIDDVKQALAVSEKRAAELIERWETRIRRALDELERVGRDVTRTAAEAAEQGLHGAARISAWIAAGLLFGWIAALLGAFWGTSLSQRMARTRQ